MLYIRPDANKYALSNRNQLLKLFSDESASISYLVMYCFLLSTDAENDTYLGSMMALTSKLSILSRFFAEGKRISRQEYHDALTVIKNKEEMQKIIDNESGINWEIEGISSDELAEYYYPIYSKVIDYLSWLFSQEKFQEEYIAVYPLACVLDYIFVYGEFFPDCDISSPFFDGDEIFGIYYPAEWSDDFCMPFSCDMNDTMICDVCNDYLIYVMKKGHQE